MEEPTEEGGAVLMCVSQLPTQAKAENKKEKDVTIGFLVRLIPWSRDAPDWSPSQLIGHPRT